MTSLTPGIKVISFLHTNVLYIILIILVFITYSQVSKAHIYFNIALFLACNQGPGNTTVRELNYNGFSLLIH